MKKMNLNAIPSLTKDEKTAIRLLKEKLEEDFSVHKIILFGSKARGDFHGDSDTDLFVLLDGVESSYPIWEKVQTAQFDVICDVPVPLMTKFQSTENWDRIDRNVDLKENIEEDGIEIGF